MKVQAVTENESRQHGVIQSEDETSMSPVTTMKLIIY